MRVRPFLGLDAMFSRARPIFAVFGQVKEMIDGVDTYVQTLQTKLAKESKVSRVLLESDLMSQTDAVNHYVFSNSELERILF